MILTSNAAFKPHLSGMMRLQAAKGFFNGKPDTKNYLESCRMYHKPTGTMLIFTRDIGYHSSGWFKNPAYERCYHLSVSFKGIQGDEVYALPRSRRLSEQWIDAFFGEDKKMIWTEPPYSATGKQSDVWHYRLFCDESWDAIKPTGEVYSKKDTPGGWLSYSDLQYEIGKYNKDK